MAVWLGHISSLGNWNGSSQSPLFFLYEYSYAWSPTCLTFFPFFFEPADNFSRTFAMASALRCRLSLHNDGNGLGVSSWRFSTRLGAFAKVFDELLVQKFLANTLWPLSGIYCSNTSSVKRGSTCSLIWNNQSKIIVTDRGDSLAKNNILLRTIMNYKPNISPWIIINLVAVTPKWRVSFHHLHEEHYTLNFIHNKVSVCCILN